MNFKTETQKLLKTAKSLGYTQRDIAIALQRSPGWITEGLSKGGNADLYHQIRRFVESLEINNPMYTSTATKMSVRSEKNEDPIVKKVAELEARIKAIEERLDLIVMLLKK